MKKFEKLDRIELTSNDIEKITKWKVFHYDELKGKGELHFPIEEGLLVIKEDFSDIVSKEQLDFFGIDSLPYNEIMIYFKMNKVNIGMTCEMYIQESGKLDEAPTLIWTLDEEYLQTEKFKWKSGFKRLNLPEDVAQGQAKHHTALLIDLFTYMVYVSENVIEKKSSKTITKKGKGGKSKSRKVRISVTRYVFNHETNGERKYDRHTLGWTVRGHWRYYKKSGKQVWIEGYVKGDKKNVEGKTYQV